MLRNRSSAFAETRLSRTDLTVQHKCASVPLPTVCKSFLPTQAERNEVIAQVSGDASEIGDEFICDSLRTRNRQGTFSGRDRRAFGEHAQGSIEPDGESAS